MSFIDDDDDDDDDHDESDGAALERPSSELSNLNEDWDSGMSCYFLVITENEYTQVKLRQKPISNLTYFLDPKGGGGGGWGGDGVSLKC